MPLPAVMMSGRDALLLDRPHRAAASHAGLHLVADEQDPVPVAELAQVAEPALGRQHVAALAEPGLDDDGRHLARRHHALEQDLLEVLEVAVEGVVHARQHRTEVRPVLRLAGGERDAAHRAAVERLVEADQVLAARAEPRELHGGLDGLGAGVRQEHAGGVVTERREGRQPLGHLRVDRQVEVAGGVVHQLGRLPLHGLDHARVAVPGGRDGDAGVDVEEDIAVHVLDDRPGAAAGHERVRPWKRRRRDAPVAFDPRPRLRARDLRDELGTAVRGECVVGELGPGGAHSSITVRDCSRRYCRT